MMKSFFLAVFILPAFAQAQKLTDSAFVITGKVIGLPEKSEVFLTDGNNGKDTLAKGLVKDGIFILKGRIPEPNIFELNFSGPKKKTALFIGNDKIAIAGTADNLKELQVSGSVSNNDFMDFQKVF